MKGRWSTSEKRPVQSIEEWALASLRYVDRQVPYHLSNDEEDLKYGVSASPKVHNCKILDIYNAYLHQGSTLSLKAAVMYTMERQTLPNPISMNLNEQRSSET